MGFLVSHSLLTNTFEFSLQLVNPKLTLPYWDFTIETTSAANVAYDPKLPFTRTELLSPSWFGTVDLEDKVVRGVILAFLRQTFVDVVVVVGNVGGGLISPVLCGPVMDGTIRRNVRLIAN